MAAALPHVPVLEERIVGLFADAPDGPIVDATLGAAGHAAPILDARRARHGRAVMIGLDRDPDALTLATERLDVFAPDDRVEVTLVRTRFDAFDEVLDALGVERVAGVLFDLGISSMHVDRAERGFSYRQDGPLDMRMDPDAPISAATLVNELDERELAGLLRRYADEKFAGRIARAIVAARPISSTVALAAIVRDAIPQAGRRTGGHPATRTFQALRIAVNGELDALESVLPQAIDRLMPDGICVALSYHSLEDRLVKRAFTAAMTGCICPPDLPICACGREPLATALVRRSEQADDAEIAANPRASAARLRAIRRTDVPPYALDPQAAPGSGPDRSSNR